MWLRTQTDWLRCLSFALAVRLDIPFLSDQSICYFAEEATHSSRSHLGLLGESKGSSFRRVRILRFSDCFSTVNGHRSSCEHDIYRLQQSGGARDYADVAKVRIGTDHSYQSHGRLDF